MPLQRGLILGGLAAADAVALGALRPHWDRLAAEVSAPSAWLAEVGPDGALAALAGVGLWLVAAWLGVGLLCAATSRLPGVLGRIAGTACRIVLPGIMQRLIIGSAGLGVFLAPVAAAAPAGPPPVSASGVPAPVWPVGSDVPTGSLPAPSWPAGTPPAPSSPSSSTAPSESSSADRATPSAPAPRPSRSARTVTPSSTSPPAVGPTHAGPAQPNPAPRPSKSAPAPPPVRVQAGDSLWLLAAHRLGAEASDAQIAAAWPRWYAANRDVIGDDPALIKPGQVLHAPASTARETR